MNIHDIRFSSPVNLCYAYPSGVLIIFCSSLNAFIDDPNGSSVLLINLNAPIYEFRIEMLLKYKYVTVEAYSSI